MSINDKYYHTLWAVDISYAYFGIIVNEENIIVETAPIGRWMIGKEFITISKWVGKKRGYLIPILQVT